MSTSNLTPELVRETLRQADAPLALGAAIARAGRAVGAAISDAEGVKAVSMPAAEAMDWRATCLIEEARDGMLNVHSPDRRHFLCRDGWHDYPNGYDVSELGCYVSRVGAAKALAACQSPYPGFIPSAIEAAHNADIGDGLGLDHDQSRRTMGATLAKMPELARKPNPTNSLRIVGKLAMKPVPGGFDLFNAVGTRVASMSVGWNSHMDPAMQQTQDQAKAIGQALVDLWNADYDQTTQQVADDVREKIRDDRN